MSKLEIIMWTVLFAAAVDASLNSTDLGTAKTNAFEDISKKMQRVYEIAAPIMHKVEKAAELLRNEYSTIINKIFLAYGALENTVKKGMVIPGITDDAYYIAVYVLLNNFISSNSYAVWDKTTTCFKDEAKTREDYIAGIRRSRISALISLTEIRQSAEYCDGNDQDLESFYSATFCIQAAQINATSIVSKIEILSTFWNIELDLQMETLRPAFAKCMATNGFPLVFQNEVMGVAIN